MLKDELLYLSKIHSFSLETFSITGGKGIASGTSGGSSLIGQLHSPRHGTGLADVPRELLGLGIPSPSEPSCLTCTCSLAGATFSMLSNSATWGKVCEIIPRALVASLQMKKPCRPLAT